VSTPLRAIIVEDSPDDAELLARELRRSGYEVTYERVHDAEGLDLALARGRWDIVFSDHSMPDFGSGVALQMVRGRDPDVPFLIVSGTMGEDVAVDYHACPHAVFMDPEVAGVGLTQQQAVDQVGAEKREEHVTAAEENRADLEEEESQSQKAYRNGGGYCR